jgi:hypothetical protein
MKIMMSSTNDMYQVRGYNTVSHRQYVPGAKRGKYGAHDRACTIGKL